MKKLLAILLTLNTLSTMAQSTSNMTLYFIPSPVGMDWSTPSKLAVSALKNRLTLKSRFMGHVFVELKCGEKREITGMVGQNFDYLRQLLVENRGLGILYHSFEGRLEDAAEVDAELKTLAESGERLNFVNYNLNAPTCERLMTYLKEYREKNVGRYYGLANRPLYGEGAGCSAFGASFVEVAGLMDSDLKDAWSNTINIPMKFAGPPLKDEGVNLLKLMLAGGKWADEKEPHKKLFFWEPDRMFRWVNSQLAKPGMNMSTTTFGKARGLVIDKTHYPAPEGPIFQQTLDPNIKTTSVD